MGDVKFLCRLHRQRQRQRHDQEEQRRHPRVEDRGRVLQLLSSGQVRLHVELERRVGLRRLQRHFRRVHDVEKSSRVFQLCQRNA